jgi:hypothetical protein
VENIFGPLRFRFEQVLLYINEVAQILQEMGKHEHEGGNKRGPIDEIQSSP